MNFKKPPRSHLLMLFMQDLRMANKFYLRNRWWQLWKLWILSASSKKRQPVWAILSFRSDRQTRHQPLLNEKHCKITVDSVSVAVFMRHRCSFIWYCWCVDVSWCYIDGEMLWSLSGGLSSQSVSDWSSLTGAYLNMRTGRKLHTLAGRILSIF